MPARLQKQLFIVGAASIVGAVPLSERLSAAITVRLVDPEPER